MRETGASSFGAVSSDQSTSSSNKSSPSKGTSGKSTTTTDGAGTSIFSASPRIGDAGGLVETLLSQVDEMAVEAIIATQKKSLGRFERTNELLRTCCTIAGRRLAKAERDFAANRELIMQAKSDLDSIFRQIRGLKHSIAENHPEVYARVRERRDARRLSELTSKGHGMHDKEQMENED